MKYIGIRGHRGAGKDSVSYLLGMTIDYMLSHDDMEGYDEQYNIWVQDLMSKKFMINNADTTHVYFDSFADTLRLILYLMLGTPSPEWLCDDYYKDHTVVNIKDFTYKVYEKIPENIKLYNREELYNILSKNAPSVMSKDVFMTLRELILYFGSDVMQRFFGLNIWIKIIQATDKLYDDAFSGYDCRIYTDVKTPSEVTYILNKEGYIIQILRPGKVKKGSGFDKLSKDGRVDYTIQVNGDLYSIKEQILYIAKQIYQKD